MCVSVYVFELVSVCLTLPKRIRCPKLVGQVESENIQVRRNALDVLCDDMRNPEDVCGE